MEDERIIDLYWQRSQEAISRTDEKYGRLCTKISLNILSNAQDAEECVSDTYMALWNSIPPQRPTCFQAFAAAIVRNLSLMKLREQYARKRGGGEFDLVLDELKDTIASGDSVEAECERKEFAAAVNQFLCTLSADDRNIFVCRYWFFASMQGGTSVTGRWELGKAEHRAFSAMASFAFVVRFSASGRNRSPNAACGLSPHPFSWRSNV